MRIIDSLDDPIKNPTVFLGSFEWREPVTTLTDAAVSLVCIYAFFAFLRYKGERSEGFGYFKIFFLLFGIGIMASALFGHALVAYFDAEWKTIGWALNSFAQIFLGLAILKEIAPIMNPRVHKSVKIFFILQVSVFVVLILNPGTRNFIYAQLCTVVSLIFLVLPMQIFNYSKTKSKGSMYFIIAIGLGLFPALFFNAKISISRWFNYHDISHVFMAAMMFFMYLGASRYSFKEKYT